MGLRIIGRKLTGAKLRAAETARNQMLEAESERLFGGTNVDLRQKFIQKAHELRGLVGGQADAVTNMAHKIEEMIKDQPLTTAHGHIGSDIGIILDLL